jgi:hypothetical protein
MAALQGGVASSAQYGVDGQTDVFTVGPDGQLKVAWVLGGGAWSGPAGIGPAGLFPAGAAVTASPQYGVDGQTDVFTGGPTANSRSPGFLAAQPGAGPPTSDPPSV